MLHFPTEAENVFAPFSTSWVQGVYKLHTQANFTHTLDINLILQILFGSFILLREILVHLSLERMSRL